MFQDAHADRIAVATSISFLVLDKSIFAFYSAQQVNMTTLLSRGVEGPAR
jgi:hypothetical protein